MVGLLNTRQEIFAQWLAAGRCQKEAYEHAGYEADDGNASRLATSPDVQNRIQELMARNLAMRSANVMGLTARLDDLLENIEPDKGVGHLHAATKMIMIMAQLNGLLHNRHAKPRPESTHTYGDYV